MVARTFFHHSVALKPGRQTATRIARRAPAQPFRIRLADQQRRLGKLSRLTDVIAVKVADPDKIYVVCIKADVAKLVSDGHANGRRPPVIRSRVAQIVTRQAGVPQEIPFAVAHEVAAIVDRRRLAAEAKEKESAQTPAVAGAAD